MNSSMAYKSSLSLPLLFPLLIAPLLSADYGSIVSGVATLIVGAGIFGGIPYAVLAVLLLALLRDSDERRIRHTLAAAPLLMLPVLWIYLAAVDVIAGWPAPRWNYARDWAGPFALCVVVIGYAYVATVFAGIAVLKRARLLT
jgi:hypothetical protein